MCHNMMFNSIYLTKKVGLSRRICMRHFETIKFKTEKVYTWKFNIPSAIVS